jgi:hypothetical protein
VRLRQDFASSVPKDLERPELNEDAWACDELLTCVAVSDGASESYDSKRWARALVDRYSANQMFDWDWVSGAVTAYNSTIDFSALSWSQQMAFDRGSFATLLALQLAENGSEVEILGVGDSLAVHVRDGALLATFPYEQAEQFDENPMLLSTLSAENLFIKEPGFFQRNSSKTWVILPGDVIYLMTDAVGQWLLGNQVPGQTPLELLDALSTHEEFSALTLQLRSENKMKLDDSTLIRLVVEST